MKQEKGNLIYVRVCLNSKSCAFAIVRVLLGMNPKGF